VIIPTSLAVAVLLAGCSAGDDAPIGPAVLTIYVSLPLHGPSAADGRDAADGARLALADAGGWVGDAEVRTVVLDDTIAADGGARWSPARAAANARRATEDAGSVAYIGEFESGATRASLAVTNEAELLQVSPASSADDLVAAFPGSEEVPDAQPTGERTFGRVVGSDAAQAGAGARWVERLGVRRVATLSDGTEFGDSLVESFEEALRRATLGRRAGFVYYGGLADHQAASRAQSAGQLMVSDAEIVPGVHEPPGTLATSAPIDPSQLPPIGQRFARRFEDEHGRAPGRYAAYGYEAMAVVLDAIGRASDPTDRAAVIDAFFDTDDRDSILGSYSITETGETTLATMTGYRFGAGGGLEPVAELIARDG
jgi:branched-chain amino acid transport system substrate-binding protein